MASITKVRLALATAAAFGVIAPKASATPLLNLVNPAYTSGTSYALNFTATGSATTISIGGYQVPSDETVINIGVFYGISTVNLLGGTFSLVRATSGSDTNLSGVGSGGVVPNLVFAGVSVGYYDTYSQTIATSIGDVYTLDFTFTNSASSSPSALLVTTSGTAGGVVLVPEPASFGMLGMGLLGMAAAMRRRPT